MVMTSECQSTARPSIGPRYTPMKPAGKVSSVRTLPSTLIRRCLTIAVTSRPVKAYFNRLRRKTVRGSDSRSLWGPGDGRGACRRVSIRHPSYASQIYSRRSRPICPASMRKELPIA